MADAFLTIPHLPTKDLVRLFSKIRIDSQVAFQGSPCWLWTAHLTPDGYAETSIGSDNALAHRVFYAWLIAPLPKGRKMVLDHLCRNRHCCNPCHLELVPSGLNILRGTGPSAQKARQTHCKRGHVLSGDNLYLKKRGEKFERVCRQCRKVSDAERFRRRYQEDPEFRALRCQHAKEQRKQIKSDPEKKQKAFAYHKEYLREWRHRKRQKNV